MTKLKRYYKLFRTSSLVVIILGIAFSGAYGGYKALTRTTFDLPVLTMEIKPKDLTLRVSANGELQSAESSAIAVPNVPVDKLRIATVVPDGHHVKKGDVLVEFDPAELNLQVLENRSNLDIANQKINKSELAVGVEKMDITKDKVLAEMELEKINEFLPRDEQIYSQRQIIEGQLDKGYTEKKIVFAGARLELKGKVYSLDEAILMLEQKQANAKINQVEKALASLKLISPASGIVTYNDPGFFFGGYTLMPGRVVWIGMPLFNLVNPDKMEAKCFVLEKDAGEVKVGQTVRVTLDPFPGVEFTGKVKSIDKLARPIDRDSPVKYFQTIVSLDKTDPELMKPGVKMKVQIVTGELKTTIVVPRSAVVKKDSGFVVYVQREPNKYEPLPVTLGQGDLIQVAVTEGLKPGQIVALNPPDVKKDLSPGAKKTGK
jgi:HlyD family secretion protein